MKDDQLVTRIGARLAWPAVGFVTLVLIVFATIRAIDIYTGHSTEELFEARYLEHPVIAAIHMFCGIAFILFAPLQFNSTFRRKHLNTHRRLGRVLLLCAFIAGIYGMISIIALPVFGGLASASAAWFFGTLFLFSLGRAFWCIRQKQINQHREWMIRSLAIALGVGTQRVIIFIFIASGSYGLEQVFGPAQWLGFAFNAVIAEIWINQTRAKR